MKRTAKVPVTHPGGNASKGSLRYSITIPPVMMQGLGITPEDRDITITFENDKIIIEKGENEMEIKKFTGIKRAVGTFNNWQGHAEIMMDVNTGETWCNVFNGPGEYIDYHGGHVHRLESKAAVRMEERDYKTSMAKMLKAASDWMKP